ncbi:MAG: twin-arginine translocation pathway signal protein [Burkholderiales bacterium 68-12]|nr:MAG: twin-arginine translocation pathway signal protein [Burkholderiales bacterium 68-12]
MTPPLPSPRRRFLGHCARWLAAGAALPQAAPALAALPDARHLALEHTHTREQIALVYALGESFLAPALESLNHFLRDHYSGAVGPMDPQLFHLLHRVRQELGAQQPFQVISGYRSPGTNATLRETRGGGVARRSLHMDGKAIDVRLPGVSLADLRDAARSLRGGGVGFYPREQFVHIDTGRVRHW